MSRAARAAGLGLLLAAAVPAWARAQSDPLRFTGDPLPTATLGEAYLTATSQPVVIGVEGGTTPYTFRRIAGLLPPGIALSAAGVLSGVPTACGLSLFQVQVRDAAGAAINGTLVVEVLGDGDLVVPGSQTPTIEAGTEAVVSLALSNVGCTSVPFHFESEDQGFLPPPEATSSLARLRRAGLPLPAQLGTVVGDRRPRSEGWSIDAEGRLVDPEGNAADSPAAPPRPTGLVPTANGSVAVLYVNESITQGERERLTGLGFTVVESLVPQALDDATLAAFDVVWLTAATDAAFPSREALRRFVWEGGGLIMEQVEIGGVIPLLPPGYALAALPNRPIGNNNVLQFLAAGLLDPLTQGLDPTELPANFDTTTIAGSGETWTFLAVQRDLPSLGILAVANYGSGRFLYTTGNLGTSVVPGVGTGSDEFLRRLVERAVSGTFRLSCPWLDIGDATSSARPELVATTTVEPGGDLVSVPLAIDARGLEVGTHQCLVSIVSDEDVPHQRDISLEVNVVAPAELRLGPARLPRAEPARPYAATLPAYGGTPPYLFTLVDGGFPPGLVLDAATGIVSGTPTGSGIFRPRVRLTDAGAGLDEETFRIDTGLVITTDTLPDGVFGGIYVEPVTAAGGVPPYSFALAPAVDIIVPATSGPGAAVCTSTDLGNGQTQTDCTLDSGPYQVQFLFTDGRLAPPAVDVVVPDGGMATAEGVYLTPGSITVTTNLESANYRLTSQTPSGLVTIPGTGLTRTFEDLRPGEWTVTFLSSQGFATPPPQTGTLTDGGTLAFDAIFVSVVPTPAAPLAAEVDIGFGQGTLRVLTNVPGATARVLANNLPTLMELIRPNDLDAEAEAGTSAALVGRFISLGGPALIIGRSLPFAVIVTDSAGNRFRQPYAPIVRTFPSISAFQPATIAEGMQLPAQITGSNLRTTATVNLGPGVTLSGLAPFSESGGSGLRGVIEVPPGVATGARDLIYTDPALSQSNFTTTLRRPAALEIFPTVERADMDGSGRVDGFDLALLARTFGLPTSHPDYNPAADLTRDDAVDGDDLSYFVIDFGRIRLTWDDAALPPAPATLGVEYVYGIPLLGGNIFIRTNLIAGVLPDGITADIEVDEEGEDPPELVFRGIPAQVGSFPLTFQAVDGFFSVDLASFTLTVNP